MKKKPAMLFSPDCVSQTLDQAQQRVLETILNEPDRFSPSTHYLAVRQSKEFLKKYAPLALPDVETETFIKFLDNDSYLQKVVSTYCFPERLVRGCSSVDRVLLRAKSIIDYTLGEFCEDEFFAYCKSSHGASIGVSYSDTSLEKKFSFPMSCTEGVDKWFSYYLSWDPQLRRGLEQNNNCSLNSMFDIVSGSRATTVPKDAKSRRLICIEPTLNMFFQQGLMKVLESRLLNVGLSFESLQDEHKVLAFDSSITGRNATIDWSSASDSVSTELLRWILPRKWFYYLDLFRSKVISMDGSLISPANFSSMGNATTFPIETLVFWAFGVASSMQSNRSLSSLADVASFKNCSVFGDDCILPACDAPLFIEALTSVGFRVNNEKTFIDHCGFRESCGGDYFHGMNVRPYYLRAPHDNRQSSLEPWLYIALNRFLNIAFRLYGPTSYLYHASPFIDAVSAIFCKYNLKFKIVPTDFPDDAGLKIGFDFRRFKKHFRAVDFSKITVDSHGTKYFRTCSFSYFKKKAICDALRLACQLKQASFSMQSRMYKTREKGGYVARKNTSCSFNISL